MRQDPFAHEFYYSFINWGLRMLELANRLGVTKDLPNPISSNLDIPPVATENSVRIENAQGPAASKDSGAMVLGSES